MASIAANIGGPRRGGWRRWRMVGWAAAVLLLLLPYLALYVQVATDDGENIVLTRSEVVRNGTAAPIWHGTFTNHTDSLYTDVGVVVRFVDRFGQPLGEARGRADRLVPGSTAGSTLDLRAPLPAGTDGIRIHSLHWRTGGDDGRAVRRQLGPYQVWELGYVQY